MINLHWLCSNYDTYIIGVSWTFRKDFKVIELNIGKYSLQLVFWDWRLL